jgi:dienelactone hydrolase
MLFERSRPEWGFWPQDEELSTEFMRLLAAAQEGGSTIAECLLVASRINGGDGDTWHREWRKLADANRERGDAALAGGNVATARHNLLRAVNYYRAAALSLDPIDEGRRATILAMKECARSFLGHREPAGEVVTLPWLRSGALEGYFLPAPSTRVPAPAVICIGEPGHRKEEYLFKLAPHARERGLSMLAVDLLDDHLEQVVAPPDLESSISHVVDYLSSRADVDDGRIAILADGWGSSFVARGVGADPRFAAAACDGGLWDLHERAFLANRGTIRHANAIPGLEASPIARNIRCPLLITLGEDGWLKADRVRQMVQQSRTNRRDVTLKVFTASETAAAQGHADNPTLANEYIFDWLASRLGTRPSERREAERSFK